jgi:hypothetical protein
MTTIDAELDRLCDAVVASLRAHLIEQGAPDHLIAQLEGLRADPMLKDAIRTALRTGAPTFPHCEEVRSRLGWDILQ